MATREELEQAGAALKEAAARVTALAAEGVTARRTPEELEHAKAYAATAAMMRRRAAKLRARGDEDHAAYELERADVFDARAAAKRAGLPMPRELRTPAESLARVDEFRRGLATLTDAFADIEPDEWQGFRAALSVRGCAIGTTHTESYTACLAFLERTLVSLGVDGRCGERVFRPFATPADASAGIQW